MKGTWLGPSRLKQQQLPTHMTSALWYDMFELLCVAQPLASNAVCSKPALACVIYMPVRLPAHEHNSLQYIRKHLGVPARPVPQLTHTP